MILLKAQPWSVEPLPAWTTPENARRTSSRPDSPRHWMRVRSGCLC
jgi:hypothetical protein